MKKSKSIISYFNQKWIIALILSLFTYVTFLYQLDFDHFHILSFALFALLFYFYNKVPLKDKKYQKASFCLALLFSIISILGTILYQYQMAPTLSVWREFFRFKTLIYIVGLGSLGYAFFLAILPKLCTIQLPKGKFTWSNKKVFLISFLIILIGSIPYFLAYFPANMTSDTIDEFGIFINGFQRMTNHHPVLHYAFMAIPYFLGIQLFHNANMATSLVTFTQMIIMALLFAYTVLVLYKRKTPTYLCAIVTLIYAFVPTAVYNTILWKDVIFSGLFLLLTIKTTDLIETKTINLKSGLSFVLISLLTLLFRNNAIYIYLILFIASFFFLKKNMKMVLKLFVPTIAIYYIIVGPLFNMLNVEKPTSKEYIAIPLQQIGRMVYKDVSFTKEEQELINQLMPIEVMREVYNAQTVDAIKFHPQYNKNAFEKDEFTYLKLYLNLVMKHPAIAVEAYLTSTLGYYYPTVKEPMATLIVDQNEYGIERDSKLPPIIVDVLTKLQSPNVPVLGMFYSSGFVFWVLLVLAYINIKRNGSKMLYPFIPVLGLWLTIMIAAPVYAEFRYIYGIVVSLPIFLYLPFLKTKK